MKTVIRLHELWFAVAGPDGVATTTRVPTTSSCKRGFMDHYLSVVSFEQRVLQQPVQGSSESSQAARGLHSWPARLQLELQGCHISVAAVSRCQQLRQHPNSLPGSLCWHELAAPWQGRVDALERWKTRNLTTMTLFNKMSYLSQSI